MTPIHTTLEERGSRYGEYTEVATLSQHLKEILSAGTGGDMFYYQAEALDMICNKLARIVCGDPKYVDSWHDIAGYATLVVDALNKETQS
jgi:hypothetical protein